MQKIQRILTTTLMLGALLGANAWADPDCCNKGASAAKPACCTQQGLKGGWFTGAGSTASATPACCDADKAKGADANKACCDKDKAKAESCCDKEGAKK